MEDLIKTPTCLYCRGKGLPGGCKHCGKVEGKIIIHKSQETAGVMDNSHVIDFIPDFNKGLEWDSVKLKESTGHLMHSQNFNIFVESLNKIHEVYKKGSIFNKSIIIIAPRKRSKQTWAYSCIQQGIAHGYKMLPVLHTNLLSVALANMFDKPKDQSVIKTFGYNLEDLMTADALFVSVDSGWQKRNAYQLISQLMCMRADFNKPTVFLSRYSLLEMSEGDRNHEFMDCITQDKNVNRLRYPVVLQSE